MTAVRKKAVKKASDHNDLCMIAQALQFGSPVMLRHFYLYTIDHFKGKQLYSIKNDEKYQYPLSHIQSLLVNYW